MKQNRDTQSFNRPEVRQRAEATRAANRKRVEALTAEVERLTTRLATIDAEYGEVISKLKTEVECAREDADMQKRLYERVKVDRDAAKAAKEEAEGDMGVLRHKVADLRMQLRGADRRYDRLRGYVTRMLDERHPPMPRLFGDNERGL